MKQFEIEAIYTAKVTEYIQNGYSINTTTMSGHQGELAKIDLRKGNEIIRVLIERDSEYENFRSREYIRLVVGRSVEAIRRTQPFDNFCATIWNNKLEIIEERRFYQIDRDADYFVEDAAEYDAMLEKQFNRYGNRESEKRTELPEAAREIVKNAIKRKTGKSRVTVKDIKVYKRTDRKGDTRYIAEYHQNIYRIA